MIPFSFNDYSSIKTFFYPKIVKEWPFSSAVAKVAGIALLAFALIGAIAFLAYHFLKNRNIAPIDNLSQGNQGIDQTSNEKREEIPNDVQHQKSPVQNSAGKTEQSARRELTPRQNKGVSIPEFQPTSSTFQKPSEDCSQLSFEEPNLQKVSRIFIDPAKINSRDSCKKYFERALLTPGDHILKLYKYARNDPAIVAALFQIANDKISSYLPPYENSVMLGHFHQIHREIEREKDNHCWFLSQILEEGIRSKSSYHIDLFFRPLFDNLGHKHLNDLSHFIIQHDRQAWKKLKHLMEMVYSQGYHKDKIGWIKDCMFKSNHGAILNHLYSDFSYNDSLCKQISIDQLNVLVKYWKENDVTNLTSNLKSLIEKIDIALAKELLASLALDEGIDLGILVRGTKIYGNKVHSIVCGARVIQYLRSADPDDVKQADIAVIADSLSSAKWPYQDSVKDRDLELCSFLLEYCNGHFLSTVLKSFSKTNFNRDKLGENILAALLTNSRYRDNVQEVFSAYWSCWKAFDQEFRVKCSCRILPKISSAKLLKDVCQGIPKDPVEKVQIASHLRGEHIERDLYSPSGSTTYKLPLDPAILEREIPKLTFEDYYLYLTFISQQKKQSKDERLSPSNSETLFRVFEQLNDQEIENFTQYILNKHPKDSWELLFLLIKEGISSKQTAQRENRVGKILDHLVPKINDAEKMNKLWGIESISKLLSLDQINQLLSFWDKQINIQKTQFLGNLMSLLDGLDLGKCEMILINLSKTSGLSIDDLCAHQKFSSIKIPLKGYIWAAHVLQNILSSSDEESVKEDKILEIIMKQEFIPPTQYEWDDDQRKFAAFLARNCKTEHLPIIFRSILKYKYFQDRLVEGLLETLLKCPSVKKAERVEKAFEVYWTTWKTFDRYSSGSTSWRLLNYIDTKEILEAVYQAIPAHAQDRKEIIQHLKSDYSGNFFGMRQIYKVNLKKDVIDEVLAKD